MRKRLATLMFLAACGLPFVAGTMLAEDGKWVCMKNGKEMKAKGKSAKDKEKSCTEKGGTWEKKKADEGGGETRSGGGGW